MKRTTAKNRRPSRQKVLQVRVMSPRIAWFGFLSLLGRLTRVACLLGLLAAAGWGVWRGIDHAFYQNPDFSLKVLDLNTNDVVDEFAVANAAGIDLTAPRNLFDIDVNATAGKLEQIPGILKARVERHLPATLVVRVETRQPKAWIQSHGDPPDKTRQPGAMLVDGLGFAYPCPERQFESAKLLPVIELSSTDEFPAIAGKKIVHPELERCFMLLDAASEADTEAPQWIETIRQRNEWSLELKTRQGTLATFSLGEHARQIRNLRAALDHAGEKGYLIDTINLIPKYNIPITVTDAAGPPKAIPVKEASAPSADADPGTTRRARDVGSLLHRN